MQEGDEKMKSLVTGGAGFIGSHLVDELIAKNHEVHVLDNMISGHLEYLPPRAILHVQDICNKEAKQLILNEKPDIVFHLAAQADVGRSIKEPQYDADVNIKGTINILEACVEAKVKKIIFASTSAVYGNLQKELLSEHDQTVPISYYGLSKLTAESYIQLFSQTYHLPFTILRYGNVYGPRQTAKGEGGVVANFLERIKKGMPLNIHGDGKQTRDFIFVKDIVQANIAAIDKGHHEIIQISTSKRTSVNQIIDMFAQIHDSNIPTHYTVPRKGDIKHSCLSNKKAEQVLLWHPNVDIDHGLLQTYKSTFEKA